MDDMKSLNLDFSHRSSSAKNIFYSQKKNKNKKSMGEFKKINLLGPTNTSGKNPIIIYKKQNAIHQTKTSSNNNNISNTKNHFLSDGGLQKKLAKYFRSNHNNTQSHSIPNKKSKTKSAKEIQKTKNIYPFSKKNNLKEKEKLFAQTVIDGFHRPNKRPREKQNMIEIMEKNKENKKVKKNKGTLSNSKNMSESVMIDTENKKLARMNKLVENAIVYEIRKNQYETEKRQISLKDKLNFKKKGYLEHNGIETSWTIEEEVQDFDKENNINNNNNQKIETTNEDKEKKDFKNKLNKKNKSETVSNSHTMIINPSNTYNLNNNNNLINSNEDPDTNLTLDISKQHKRILKPKVNQFEFLQKIQEEQKKLPIRLNSTHNISQSQTISVFNRKINDSFRHKSLNIKPNSIEKKNNSNNLYDLKEYQRKQKNKTIKIEQNEENTEEFPFATKKHNRSLEELAEYTRKKKIKQRKEEEKKEYNKKKKLFEIFKNLSNLKESYNHYNFNNISVNMNNMNYNYHNNTNNNSISTSMMKRKNKAKKKHKEVNAYYVGTDSSKSSSTVLDVNEYYLNILESQQLVVNSKLNKIYNITQEEMNNSDEIYINDNNINMNLNNNYINNNNENVKINNYINLNDEEINEKVNDTIKRANELLQENYSMRNIDQNDLINIQENKEIKSHEKKNNTNNTNNKQIKKKEKKFENINLENINNDAIKINLDNTKNIKNKIDINTSSQQNTKEKDLPSLPHTFSNVNNSNSNQNRKLQVDVDIQPCNVLNLVEVIRLIIQRKFFYNLCQIYYNHSSSQRYIIAISYFVAICKQYPFKMLEDYCNYKTYYYAFRQLFRPFTRRYFKIFLINCISITKIGYFVESLSRMFKFKAMEKIYIYSQIKEKNDQLKKMCGIILKVILPLIKIHLKNNFDLLVKYYKNKKNTKKNNNKKNNNKSNRLIQIDFNSLYFDPLYKNKRNKTSRINSFIYDSLDSLGYSVHPNSVDNDILHQIKIEEKNKDKDNKKTKKRKSNNKNNIAFSEENSDIDINKNSLNCPKMSKHTKINFLNPTDLNDIKNNKTETPSKKDTNEINVENSSAKKDKIKIEKIKIIKKEGNSEKKKDKHDNSDIELDISAEKDKLNNKINWEYNISHSDESVKEEKEKEKIIEENKKEEPKEKVNELPKENEKENTENDLDDIIDVEDLLIDEEISKEIKPEKKQEKSSQKINIKKKEKLQIKSEIDPNKKELESNSSNKEKNEINNEIKEESQKKPKTKEDFFRNFPEELIEQITSEIIKELILTEIKNTEEPLIPKKLFKYENIDTNASNNLFNSSHSFNFRDNISKDSFQSAPNFSHQQNNISFYKDNNYPNFFLNESMLASVSAFSIFNRTIKDKKKHKSLVLYAKKVFPIMMKNLEEELYKKYNRIYENIKTPLKNNFEKIIVGLELQNGKMIKDSYKQITFKEEINDIIDKKHLLKKIENINKEIRNKDNIFDDNYYDKILNECIIDTCIELIKKERIYSNDGEPLPYCSRTKELVFKYEKNKPKKFVNYIMEQLFNIFNTKLGLINTNYEYLTQDQLNSEKEKRLINVLKEELVENEEHWKNLEIEETQLKLEITEIINEQLYNEVMEILEHITLSRKKPELYQYKSIFSCEDIPKLVFQRTYDGSNQNDKIDDDELINVE